MENYVKIILKAYKVMRIVPGHYAPVEDQVINFVDWCVKQLRDGIHDRIRIIYF